MAAVVSHHCVLISEGRHWWVLLLLLLLLWRTNQSADDSTLCHFFPFLEELIFPNLPLPLMLNYHWTVVSANLFFDVFIPLSRHNKTLPSPIHSSIPPETNCIFPSEIQFFGILSVFISFIFILNHGGILSPLMSLCDVVSSWRRSCVCCSVCVFVGKLIL